MPDRKMPFPTPWLASALALLAWMLLAPTWSTGSGATPTRAALSVHESCPPPSPPATCLGAAVPVDTHPQVNALPSEGEEQDQVDVPGEARVPFQPPGSFRLIADRRPIAPRPIPSLYPLRC